MKEMRIVFVEGIYLSIVLILFSMAEKIHIGFLGMLSPLIGAVIYSVVMITFAVITGIIRRMKEVDDEENEG